LTTFFALFAVSARKDGFLLVFTPDFQSDEVIFLQFFPFRLSFFSPFSFSLLLPTAQPDGGISAGSFPFAGQESRPIFGRKSGRSQRGAPSLHAAYPPPQRPNR
jgi:hypothetical protein